MQEHTRRLKIRSKPENYSYQEITAYVMGILPKTTQGPIKMRKKVNKKKKSDLGENSG